MFLSMAAFILICTAMAVFGFYDRAKHRAAHPEEFTKKKI